VDRVCYQPVPFLESDLNGILQERTYQFIKFFAHVHDNVLVFFGPPDIKVPLVILLCKGEEPRIAKKEQTSVIAHDGLVAPPRVDSVHNFVLYVVALNSTSNQLVSFLHSPLGLFGSSSSYFFP